MKKRKFEETHPWLTFSVSLDLVSPEFWMLLGEIQAKCMHVAGIPLLPEIAHEFFSIYLAKGAQGTTAIEGNTLSEEEVFKQVQGRLKLPASKAYLGTEVDNIITACNDIAKDVLVDEGNHHISFEDICRYNAHVLNGLEFEKDQGVRPGKIRQHQVSAGGYQCAPSEDCVFLLEKMLEWINSDWSGGQKDRIIAVGVLKAVLAHLYFVWIHPFGDGNGRTARLIEFRLLLEAGVPAASAHLLSNFYNETRSKYYAMLDQARKKSEGVINFIMYALEGFRDQLEEQLQRIRFNQWDTIWVNYIHKKFAGKNSATATRQRRLLLDITEAGGNVPIGDVRFLTPRLAREYDGKLQKTATRDVNALVNMGLLEKKGGKVRAKNEIILSFLPARREP